MTAERNEQRGVHATMTQTIDMINGSGEGEGPTGEELHVIKLEAEEARQSFVGRRVNHAHVQALAQQAELNFRASERRDECRVCAQALTGEIREQVIKADREEMLSQLELVMFSDQDVEAAEQLLQAAAERQRAAEQAVAALGVASAQAGFVQNMLDQRTQLVTEGKALTARIEAMNAELGESESQAVGVEEEKRSIAERHQYIRTEMRALSTEISSAKAAIAQMDSTDISSVRSVADVDTDLVAAKVAAKAAVEAMNALGSDDSSELVEHVRLARIAVNEAKEALAHAAHELESCEAEARETDAAVAKKCAERDLLVQALEDAQAAEVTIEKAKAEMDTLRRVETAFGPSGIPAMILDDVIVELTSVASELLNELSNGRFSVEFKTVGETKAGVSKQSLDIIIRDGSKERPYMTFSGGERMRIDIAIRIGLSVLMARRAGSPLEFLTIDEGFGALDAEGVNTLTTALAKLQSRFALIMVVTHVPEVAEAFPARLEFTSRGKTRSPKVQRAA